ncbi:restriction endonuclease [Bradyrhizobium sp. 1.29L]
MASNNNAAIQLIEELQKRLGKASFVAPSPLRGTRSSGKQGLDALHVGEASIAAARERARIQSKISELKKFIEESIERSASAPLSVSTIISPINKVAEGILVKSTSLIWASIVQHLETDWSYAYQIPPTQWEEIVAGAFDKAGFDEVVLTPRSGDYGRDVIAIRKGIGSIKIIGSVKAYKLGHLVKHDDVRALLGVLAGDTSASKGILTTTSDFAPTISSDPFIKNFLPTRLELMNGDSLKRWLVDLVQKT